MAEDGNIIEPAEDADASQLSANGIELGEVIETSSSATTALPSFARTSSRPTLTPSKRPASAPTNGDHNVGGDGNPGSGEIIEEEQGEIWEQSAPEATPSTEPASMNSATASATTNLGYDLAAGSNPGGGEIIEEEKQGEIWEDAAPQAGNISQETSSEIWELPGTEIKENVVIEDSIPETVVNECDTQAFLRQGGLQLDLGYDYDLLYRSGADVQSDIIELDEAIAKNLRSQLKLMCDDNLTYNQSSNNGTDIYWIDRGYLDVPDRMALCTSREGKSAANFDLGCVPMKGGVNVFYLPSADPVQVKEMVLDVVERNGLQTKSQSWTVYVDNRPQPDATGVVASATDGGWTDQSTASVTVKSILVYSFSAVFGGVIAVVLAVFIYNNRRKSRIKKEMKQYDEFKDKLRKKQEARRAWKAANKEAAMANKQFSDQCKKEAAKLNEEESLRSRMGHEAELCGAAAVVHSVI